MTQYASVIKTTSAADKVNDHPKGRLDIYIVAFDICSLPRTVPLTNIQVTFWVRTYIVFKANFA
jgi:hypothetical protein